MIVNAQLVNQIEVDVSVEEMIKSIENHIRSKLHIRIARYNLSVAEDGRVFYIRDDRVNRVRWVDVDYPDVKITDNMKNGIKLLNCLDNYNFYEKTTKEINKTS